ncbi:MAG: hypothetical protein WA101_02060 [Minisyncoccia bacterium]
MEENIKKAFYKIKYAPEPNLTQHICKKIELRDKHFTNIKLYVFSFIGIISFVGLIPAFKMLISDFTQSGFYEYLSLILSSGALSSSWKELVYSIAESLPTVSLLLSFGSIFIFFLSLHFILKQIIKGQFNYQYSIRI